MSIETFSVIIPAYNAAAYIGEAIESALSQDGFTPEIIVVNDGSTDSTADVAGSFGSRVTLINTPNCGVAAARNCGLQIASGIYLAFLDADDFWLKAKLKVQAMKLSKGFTMVYSNRYNIGEIGDLPELQSEVVTMVEGDIWDNLLLGNMITASSVVVKREIINALGGFREHLPPCEDWDLWLRIAAKNVIGYCPEPLVKYRLHAEGISKNYLKMNRSRQKVITSVLDSERGHTLSTVRMRRMMAAAWSSSAWEAARGRDMKQSLLFYANAMLAWPFDGCRWYDLARVICGRV
ncbi:MAG: family 2 glycosyl transferase [Deltaproteobacteria bacterium HGW-Deltaproteobacteria-23]|nr:MAG: family 2 glycosyl transferase [Deltaproteobacteria bacterium HGW-Deltaproteobacteria-23]